LGQTEKNSVRAYVFRVAPIADTDDWHLRDCGKVRGRLVGVFGIKVPRYNGLLAQTVTRRGAALP